MTYVLLPGAWAGSWVWDDVASRLRQKGHDVRQVTLSGLRSSDNAPADSAISLGSHVQQVIQFLEKQELVSVTLVGHSYSGVVIGQVAARQTDRVSHTVFVEAFLPEQGRSLLEVSGLDADAERRLIDQNHGYWPAPTADELGGQLHLTQHQIDFLNSRHSDHPGATITEPAVLECPLSDIRATLIAEPESLATRQPELIGLLKQSSRWEFRAISGGHWPMLTVPDQLASLLDEISG